MELEFNGTFTELAKLQDKYAGSLFAKGMIMTTPPIDESYWLFRVKLSENQAVVAFPKFMTLGIGFQKENDWNTNLPYSCNTEEIYNHIKHNKGDKNIRKAQCLKAIQMIQTACAGYIA
jgi:hypothetical protein